ncbi:MAG: hypothetical protein R3C28_21160 [Pirellulaceae bacterium]
MTRLTLSFSALFLLVTNVMVQADTKHYFWIVDNQSLYRIDVMDPEVTLVSELNTPFGYTLGGLAFDSGRNTLFGLLGDPDSNRANLYEINRVTGESQLQFSVAAVSESETWSGFDILPDGRALARTLDNQVAKVSWYEINMADGIAHRIGDDLPGGVTDWAAGGDNQLFDFHQGTNNGLELVSFDPTTQHVASIGAVNVTVRDRVDLPLGFNPDDQMLYWIAEDNLLLRTSPQNGFTEVLTEFQRFGLPDGENVGTFAPIPEPATNAWYVWLGAALLVRSSFARPRSRN